MKYALKVLKFFREKRQILVVFLIILYRFVSVSPNQNHKYESKTYFI